MTVYEPDDDAPKPCRHCGKTREHHGLNTGVCMTPPPAEPASDGRLTEAQCERVADEVLKRLHFSLTPNEVRDFAAIVREVQSIAPPEVQCIRPERSEVNAPAVGSHVTSPETRGDGSGDRRDGGPDAPRRNVPSVHGGSPN